MTRPFRSLHSVLASGAAHDPSAIAVVEPGGGSVTYARLLELSDAVADTLAARGVRRGDRIAVHLAKSIDAVAILFGILKAGAAYVPVDPHGPAPRNAYIIGDCAVALAFVERRLEEAVRRELSALGAAPPMIVVDTPGTGEGLERALAGGLPPGHRKTPPVEVAADDLA